MTGLLLCHEFSGIKFHKHCAVGLQFLYRHGESKVVKQKELELEVIELCQRKTPNLSIQLMMAQEKNVSRGRTLAYREFV